MSVENENRYHVAIVGGACSGKTTIYDVLRYELYRFPIHTDYIVRCKGQEIPASLNLDYWNAWDTALIREEEGLDLKDNPDVLPIHFIPEAWDKYQFIAEMVLRVLSGKETLERAQWMLNINLNFDDDYYLLPYSSHDLIRDLKLEAFTILDSPERLREIFQRDLLRIQLAAELQTHEWMQNRPHVRLVDGGILYNLMYWPDMAFDSFVPVFREYNLPYNSLEDVLNFYDAIVLIETLAVLTEDRYKRFFFDGRRLDSPQHAVEVHKRLVELVKKHPHYIVLTASTSELEKINATEQYVKQLAV